MRLDPLTGEWIAVAAARQNRVVMPPAGLDPLAPQAPGNPSEIPSDYDVAVFENRSPAFGPGLPVPGSAEADPSYLDGPGIDGPYRRPVSTALVSTALASAAPFRRTAGAR